VRDLHAHDQDLDRDEQDNNPLQRVGLVRRQDLEEELRVLLDEVELDSIFQKRSRISNSSWRPSQISAYCKYFQAVLLRSKMPILAMTSVNSVLFKATSRNRLRFSSAEKTPVRSTEEFKRVNASSMASALAA
jgi:hypothetical protein